MTSLAVAAKGGTSTTQRSPVDHPRREWPGEPFGSATRSAGCWRQCIVCSVEGGNSSHKRGKAVRRRLGLEPLEERCTPATFTVNSLLDTHDANPGDGNAQDDQGRTTLRAAIEECNELYGSHTINFGSLTGTITLSDTLKTLQ